MDVHDGGQRIVGRDRAVGQNADWLCAKCTLDMNLVGGDIGRVRFRYGAGQLQRIGAALHQKFGSQRRQWLRQRIAQFGIDKFDCVHEWQPRPFMTEQDDKLIGVVPFVMVAGIAALWWCHPDASGTAMLRPGQPV